VFRGLEGRRIFVAVLGEDASTRDRVDVIRAALKQAGAEVEVHEADKEVDAKFNGGVYAGVVALGGDQRADADVDQRLVQLAREFLASEKPVAAIGGALSMIIRAGGAAGRSLAAGEVLRPAVESAGGKLVDRPVQADGCLITATEQADAESFAAQVVREFSRLLDERDVDAMSEQSFPASDPPGTTTASTGHVAPDRDADAQP
jgi:putative intracellular protease/amidase